MAENFSTNTSNTMEEKQKALLERARKGIVQFLQEKGGKLSLAELHDYSLNKYFIQHQGFSKLMETLVADKLLEYDFEKDAATLTEKGGKFV